MPRSPRPVRPRARFWLFLLVPLGVLLGALLALGHYLLPQLPDDLQRGRAILALGAFGLGFGGLLALIWLVLDQRLTAAVAAVSHGAAIMRHSNPAHRIELNGPHLLGTLPHRVEALGRALYECRLEVAKAVTGDPRGLEAQKTRLEVVLQGLRQGVIVCDDHGRIMLYNPAARAILDDPPELGLCRPIGDLLAPAPLEHSLEQLRHSRATPGDGSESTEFVCATRDQDRLLHCKLALLPASGPLQSAFVLTLDDITHELRGMAEREQRLNAALEAMRTPLASLLAAADSLDQVASMTGDQRRAFEQLLRGESHTLNEQFQQLAEEAQRFVSPPWVMADLYTSDLLGSVTRRAGHRLPRVREIGLPLWVHAEGHAIGLVLEHLLARLAAEQGVEDITVEALMGDQRVYLDLSWTGEPVSSERLDQWLDAPQPELAGELPARAVLERHHSVAWSRSLDHGRACLRLPLPASTRQWCPPAPPETGTDAFYDFSVAEQPADLGAWADRPLDQLNCVVFDTETTGLSPARGHEIIAIGAVRLVNGRVVQHEYFEELVRPRRAIPASATRIHGISDEDVARAAEIGPVLQRFQRFVGEDTVLAAHNAAFDMGFLRRAEARADVCFRQPVLDTLLLSVYLHDHTPDHTLEGVAERLGVEVQKRHSALADARVTADILARMITLLQERGIHTLGQAVRASEQVVAVRKQQARFR
ncbi:DNA polymerase-3 subunit epsilon [Alkalispirillum mobile]|uniref:DNA-directed DNA polymerase n=1 Tax=Alkalispirillum mobile TaxID=85925 RepID=A0A498C4F0_9GAMM|nr:exonuclease domain-containing protein [Alkalispirillum mobile]RLK51054.1 DNA polymerase-3 subunit epsilon [Alkalispirillum mobile]